MYHLLYNCICISSSLIKNCKIDFCAKNYQVGLEPFCHQILNSLITVNNSFLSSTTPLYKDKGDSHALGKELNLQVFLEPNVSRLFCCI